MLGNDEIENRFGFHKATTEGENATLPKHADLRLRFRGFAEFLDDVLPDGRAKSVMFTELENASMWAHKAVAEMSPLVEESKADYVFKTWGVWYKRSDPKFLVEAKFFNGDFAEELHDDIEKAKLLGYSMEIEDQFVPNDHWVVVGPDKIIRLLTGTEFRLTYALDLYER